MAKRQLLESPSGSLHDLPGNILGLPKVGMSIVPPPEEIRFTPASVDEQRRAAAPVLIAARAAVKNGVPVLEAIADAGKAGIASEYARRAVRTVLKEWNLMAWQEHPARRRGEVLQTLDRAIAICQRKDHRGGWFVAPRSGRAA